MSSIITGRKKNFLWKLLTLIFILIFQNALNDALCYIPFNKPYSVDLDSILMYFEFLFRVSRIFLNHFQSKVDLRHDSKTVLRIISYCGRIEYYKDCSKILRHSMYSTFQLTDLIVKLEYTLNNLKEIQESRIKISTWNDLLWGHTVQRYTQSVHIWNFCNKELLFSLTISMQIVQVCNSFES